MADVILLDTVISLEVIEKVMKIRKIRLVRANVFGNVRGREWAALEGTGQSALSVRSMVHVGHGHEDLEVLGQALDGVDLQGTCQSGNALQTTVVMLHHHHLLCRQRPQTLQYSPQTA